MSLNGSQENEKSTDVTSLAPSLLTNYLNKMSDQYPQTLLSVLNLTLKQDICRGDIEVNRTLFPLPKENKKKSLLGMSKICVLQGYFRSLRPTQQGLALNIDAFTKLFHEKSNVLDFLKNLLEYKEDIQHMKNTLETNMYVLNLVILQ